MKKLYEENYNSPILVDLWTDFIDWEKRRKGENGFIVKLLNKFNCKNIIDASLGDGCDSIYLIKQGFNVVSNEVDSLFIKKALLNARKENVELKITNFDWRCFDKKFPNGYFDALLLLGNSLTYLFSKADQLKVLRAFRKVLKSGGLLVIDERNYDYILKKKKEILNGTFKYSGKYVYCGSKVHASPVEISNRRVLMKYVHKDGRVAYLSLYPFKKGELKSLIRQAGFNNVVQYSDYRKHYNPEADFYQYTAEA